MATRQLETWNETAASNDFSIDEGGAPPAHARTKVDDSNRQRMSAMASFYQDGIEWLDLLRNPTDRSIQYTVSRQSSTVIRIISGSTDLTTMFNVGRRLRTTTAGATTEDVEVLSVAHSDPNFDITIYGAGGDTITTGIDGVLLHSGAALGRFAFKSTLLQGYLVMDGLTDAAFAAALAGVPAAGGTILLLAGNTVLTQTHTIPDKCRIIGQGIGVSELSTTDKTLERLLLFSTPGSGQSLESFTITTPVTTTSGTNHVVELGTCTKVRIKDIFFNQSYGAAIKFTGVSHSDVVIESCEFYRNRGGCVISPDTNTDVDRCFIRDCGLREPGHSHTGTSYGLQLAGKWNCSGIQITELNNGGAAIQIGVEFSEKLASHPNEQDANHCSLNNFSITGTGQNARGVDMNGRYCSVTDGAISLSGSGSTGVKVAGALGSQLAQNNRTANVSFSGCAIGYDEPNTAATRNSLIGCTFDACGIDVRVAANRAVISGNVLSSSTGSQSILVTTGADRTRISGNLLEFCAGDGVSVASAATLTRAWDNTAVGVVGDDYVNDAGAAATLRNNHPRLVTEFYRYVRDSFINGGQFTKNVHQNLTNYTGITLPTVDGGSSGRTVMVEFIAGVHNNNPTLQVHMWAGDNGNITDANVGQLVGLYDGSRGVAGGSFVATGQAKFGLSVFYTNNPSPQVAVVQSGSRLRIWYDEAD